MDGRGDAKREGRSKSIIFFGDGLGRKFHRASISQVAISTFLAMAIR